MQHCQFYHKSNDKKGKFTHLGGSSVKGHQTPFFTNGKLICDFLCINNSKCAASEIRHISCAIFALGRAYLALTHLFGLKLYSGWENLALKN